MDGRLVSFDLNIGQRNARGRFVSIGNELFARSRDIIQSRPYVRQGVDCDLDHCGCSSLIKVYQFYLITAPGLSTPRNPDLTGPAEARLYSSPRKCRMAKLNWSGSCKKAKWLTFGRMSSPACGIVAAIYSVCGRLIAS